MELTWVKALRIRQWFKQLLIFLPLIATGNTFVPSDLLDITIGAFTFSFVSSAIYLINDVADKDSDREDPIKASRPVASGKISSLAAIATSLFLLTTAAVILIATTLENTLLISLVLGIYFIMNLAYSLLKLKRFRILGISLVAIGFPARFAFGSLIIDLPFSVWAVVLIFELAMFMLSGKRFQNVSREKSFSGDEYANERRFWLLSMVVFAAFFGSTFSGFISDSNVIETWGRSYLISSTIPLSMGIVRFIEIVSIPSASRLKGATEDMVTDSFLLFVIFLFSFVLFLGRLNA